MSKSKSSRFKLFSKTTISEAHQTEFCKAMLRWASEPSNIRTFPWRETSIPYELLVAECMLRRTNAAAVLPVYRAWLERYPNERAFITARNSDLLRMLSPLGLEWRAHNFISLKSTLKSLAPETLSADVNALLQFPGVGPYVARAVEMNSLRSKVIPVDTNVVRILSRNFGWIVSDNLRRNKNFEVFVDSLASRVARAEIRLFNFALLDLAASTCKATVPKCRECPLSAKCAYANDLRAITSKQVT